ncbi:MAG: PSD1 and planctomycete cytochrome C domain-containing protein, partial [Tepidisphaeraceae bacterium]
LLLALLVAVGAGPAPVATPTPVATAEATPVATVGNAKPQAARKIDFNRDIRPILSDNCYACHGPDKGHRKAELRLDIKDGLFGVRDDTFPVVPGKPDDSVLFMRITSDDPDYKMPHHNSNKKLTAAQVGLIKQWIEEGAAWKGHWAYEKPEKTQPPAVEAPGFVRNDIDKFVAEKLKELKLSHSPEADRVTLIRRLKLDLLGIPPTYDEVQAFVNDKGDDAYEKVVEKFLAAPQYGERMSVFWMDLVRFADTIGFHSDNPREVWPYRDYLVKAFNENKRFDAFTREQLAGDLLPDATREQKVASAYNRLLLTTGEGGAQAMEYVKKYESDRVRNVSTTWMGVTMGCAQCHDHKFDPFSTKDFYRMAAFFADIQEPAISLPQPELLLPSPEQEKELNRLDGALAETRKQLETPTPELAAAQEEFDKKYNADKGNIKWHKLEVTEAKSTGGATLTIGPDKATVLASGSNPATDTYEIRTLTRMKNISGLKLEVLPHASLPGNGPGRAGNGNFVLTEIDVDTEYGSGPKDHPVAFVAASASHEQADAGETNPYRRFTALATIDGDKFGPTWGWAVAEKTGQANHAVYETPFNFGDGDRLVLKIKLKMNHGGHTLGHFRFHLTDSPRPIRALPDKGIPADIVKVLETPPDKRVDKQKETLAAHYRAIAPLLQPVREKLAALTKEREDLLGYAPTHQLDRSQPSRIPRTLISVTGPPRVTRVLARGNWQDESGEIVAPGVPAFMTQASIPVDRGASRLDLANWLIARDNPLTARVFVNRLWKMFYGAGMAKPLDDLGAQGEWPTHPELLDWLAVEFMDSGWDVKHVVRLMVSSGAYRQSSNQSKEMREQDPFNRWLARQGSFRLDAEFVRDNALAISGLLSGTIGGPSVKPYQPAGYWEFLNFPKRTYEADKGESLYRRGMYTWWQRTFVNPSLLNFDAASREECTAERVRSNTPQQALTLLNDPTYVESARAFAARILTECNGDTGARLTWAFRTALSRDPLATELPILTALLDKQYKRYRFDMPAADALTSVGDSPAPQGMKTAELAAWTSVARTILNLHETITRN